MMTSLANTGRVSLSASATTSFFHAGSVLVGFRQKFTLEDAIELHTFAPVEASMHVTNVIPLGRSLSYHLAL
jgi:hypothetical protein